MTPEQRVAELRRKAAADSARKEEERARRAAEVSAAFPILSDPFMQDIKAAFDAKVVFVENDNGQRIDQTAKHDADEARWKQENLTSIWRRRDLIANRNNNDRGGNQGTRGKGGSNKRLL